MFKEKIMIDKWSRRDTFSHYIGFQNPYFNLTVPVEITALYEDCKQKKQAFYYTYLYYTTRVVNEIEEFKYRIEEGSVFKYKRIDCAPTVLSPQKKLLFSHLTYQENMQHFIENSHAETQRVLKKNVMDAGNQANVIYTTVIPWVSFTSLRHPVGQSAGSGIPLIAFGKFYEQGGKKYMPISLDVNHALMDGFHAGLFFEKLQAYFMNPI